MTDTFRDMGPSFDDVPASAAPNRRLASAASYTYSDRPRSPASSDPDELPNRPLRQPLHQYPEERWNEDNDMTRNRGLPPLQAQYNFADDEKESYRPVQEDDPTSYDLVIPVQAEESQGKAWNLEKRSQILFSREHLQVIFSDPGYLLKFTSFLSLHRSQSVPILVHYLDTLKALRAIHYSNAILEGLDAVGGLDFTRSEVEPTANGSLRKRANEAFDYLVREELPAFITHEYIQIVSASISARISGMLAPHLREASEGLAEVFCLTDPSRQDNPIVFASEEFNRTTQYGLSYVLGRNCRFLQGPLTDKLAVRRIRDAVRAGRQTQEVLLNYRRDGSPFMNLLMIAPLCDSRGVVRYHIGAQVDVSGLVKDCSEMDSLAELLDIQSRNQPVPDHQLPSPEKNDELRELSEMLNQNELNTIRKYGGRMHRDTDSDTDSQNEEESSPTSAQPRLIIKDPNTITPNFEIGEDPVNNLATSVNNSSDPGSSHSNSSSLYNRLSGRLSGIYNHYLLIRPYPSLRILFASPSQRVPGILQSPFMNKIGGSNRVREELSAALAEGRGVTAKVRWVTKLDEEGRNKWIHCTPLVGMGGQIGVWMVVIVDDERHRIVRDRERGGIMGPGRVAPPISENVSGNLPHPRAQQQQQQQQQQPQPQSQLQSHSALQSHPHTQAYPQQQSHPYPQSQSQGQGQSQGYSQGYNSDSSPDESITLVEAVRMQPRQSQTQAQAPSYNYNNNYNSYNHNNNPGPGASANAGDRTSVIAASAPAPAPIPLSDRRMQTPLAQRGGSRKNSVDATGESAGRSSVQSFRI